MVQYFQTWCPQLSFKPFKQLQQTLGVIHDMEIHLHLVQEIHHVELVSDNAATLACGALLQTFEQTAQMQWQQLKAGG